MTVPLLCYFPQSNRLLLELLLLLAVGLKTLFSNNRRKTQNMVCIGFSYIPYVFLFFVFFFYRFLFMVRGNGGGLFSLSLSLCLIENYFPLLWSFLAGWLEMVDDGINLASFYPPPPPAGLVWRGDCLNFWKRKKTSHIVGRGVKKQYQIKV